MATVWTLTLGTSFNLTSLENGTKPVAKFTTDKATLPGEISSGAINATGNIVVKSGKQDKVTLSTEGKITSGDISSGAINTNGGAINSGAITSSGAIKGTGLEGTSLDVKTGEVTCGSINSSGSVSAESGFYVE